MSYGISLSADAEHDLARLPIPVRQFTLRQLENLADSPGTMSRRSHFPYREKCQLFTFNYDHELQRWELAVLFQYGQDEQTLHILGIGRTVLDLGDGIDLDPDEPDEAP